MIRTTIVVGCLLFLSSSSANAAIVLGNTFPVQTTGDSPFSAGQVTDPNITSTGVSRIGYSLNGGGFVGGDSALVGGDYRNFAGSGNINSSTRYFEFNIQPVTGYEVDLTDFTYEGFVTLSGSSTIEPDIFQLRSSRDSYATQIPGANLLGTTIDLSDTEFQDLTSPVNFRLYIQSSDPSANPSSTYNLDSFAFNGTVSAVPEPSSMALLAFGGAGLAWRRRKSKKNSAR
ncbi:hypothetical protein RISK_001178 [Rhodopirellula islandica]|uniref:Ice-binding protein C-terminal domain-containing protein n=1 Tax=Rhodopirellula islandica TaxID=595434 RepID=A0A0J1EMY6_RHOIS|nr:PEP-CTERM sorting domain-containing protein [Rhodopirellula islandica]KLU06864.1 hypothetical protein RISK_001178 [Rhodopirellula islandica]